MRSFWKRVGQVRDFHCLCCTCHSNTKYPLSCPPAVLCSGPGLAHSLRRGGVKNSHGETEKEIGPWVRNSKKRDLFLLTWPSLRSSWETCREMSFFLRLKNSNLEWFVWYKTIFSLSQSILILAARHCHTSNAIKLISMHFSISSHLGKCSQLFSSTFSCCLEKQKPWTVFQWYELTLVPGRFQQSATAVFDTGEARAESFLRGILAHVLAEMGLILKQLFMYLTVQWDTFRL